MCEFAGKLVAWIDGELAQDDAAAVEQHVAACAQCRRCVAEFERVTREFDAYCDAVARSKGQRGSRLREPILWAATAAVVLAAIFAYPRREVAPVPQQPNAIAAVSKPSPDATRTSPVQPAPHAMVPGTAAINPARPNTSYAHTNRVAAKRGEACCAVAKTKDASADSAVIARPAGSLNANWVANEPSVQVAISATAMFPPGAIPAGINFVADLSIGADGTVQQVRLQPQVSEFERRSSQ